MFPREQQFANLLTKQKRKWEYPTRRFDLGNTHYRPDFYLPKENLYIEVIGTRQAYHSNKSKILKFKSLYPHIKFIIVDFENNLLSLSKVKKFPKIPFTSFKYRIVEYFDSVIPLTRNHSSGQCVETNNEQSCITCKAIRNYWQRKRYHAKKILKE